MNHPRSRFLSLAWTAILLLGLAATARANGTLKGVVRDLGGEPLAGVTVLLQANEIETVTDAGGAFEFAPLPEGIYNLEARAAGYVVETLDGVEVWCDEITEVAFRLYPVATPLDEIVVSSRISILQDEPVTRIGLDREQIQALPHFGDDLYRAVQILPGTSSGDISARFSVRGGLPRDTLVELDGMELFEPFHLKDFQGVFSVLDPEIISGLDLMPGGFPVEHGDRLGSVLDMTTIRPTQLRTSLGISFSNAWAGSAGTFAGDRGRWLASARRGYLDIILGIVEPDDDEEQPSPKYWDAFGKLDYDLTASSTGSIQLLASDDDLLFEEIDGDEFLDINTGYGNQSLWLSYQNLIGSHAFFDTILYLGSQDDDRRAFFEEISPPELFLLNDLRQQDILGLKLDWNQELSDRHYLKLGFDLRTYDADYEYVSDLQDSDGIDDPRFPPPVRSTEFSDVFSSDTIGLYVADRMRIGQRWTAELGVRYDSQSLTDDDQWSPRANVVWEAGEKSLMRAGWGRFFQSQRPNELQVQFGETEFFDAEESEHWTLGYERELSTDYALRAEVYRRDEADPRPRYDTLFDPFGPIPEANKDLVRIDAESATAQGVELFLRRQSGPKFGWWVSYVYSEIEDQVAGELGPVDQPRFFDQTHAFVFNGNWRPSRKWNINWVWTYHSGWPTTEALGELIPNPEGGFDFTYHIGPFYQENLSDYHRLDVRASRSFELSRSEITLFLDVQNLYNRDNVRGIDIDDENFFDGPDGRILATFEQEEWLPILPSFGISWEF